MKLRKIVAAYFSDLANEIESEKISDECVKGLLHAIMQIEEHKDCSSDPKECSKEECSSTRIEDNKKELLTLLKNHEHESLASELMDFLGLPGDAMEMPAHAKITIKKVSSKDDLDKILKGLKNGGPVDINTLHNSELSEIFEDDILNLILEAPMFKLGGSVFNDVTLEEFLNEKD